MARHLSRRRTDLAEGGAGLPLAAITAGGCGCTAESVGDEEKTVRAGEERDCDGARGETEGTEV